MVAGLASPVDIVHCGDGSGRLFVAEQPGRIRVIREGLLVSSPFLDLTPVTLSGGEMGLLSLTFHPAYGTNGRFFVLHTVPSQAAAGGNDVVVAEYARSTNDPGAADSSSRRVLLSVPHPQFTNHNGGKLAFGPDGYLYVSLGDGGGGGDPFNAAQDLADLRGKLLRIDVDSGSPYGIPPSNPFVSMSGARPEIFAYGLRNPWRIAFDRTTGDLFIADVGQGAREEVNFIAAGGAGGQNFGWHVFEGTGCHDPPIGCSLSGHTRPILEYGHDASGGFSITGGYRYRGRAFPELRGHYVYADYVSGRMWAALPIPGGAWSTAIVATLNTPSTFGEDEAGELYVANHTEGSVLRIVAPDADADGMSDGFEARYFGDATAGNPAEDTDGDGMTNIVEYREGRSPFAKDNDVFDDARLFAMQQYRDFLGREGEAGGIDFWSTQVANGTHPRANVIEFFLLSPEFRNFIAPVARLYFAYFQRIPDHGGLQFWIARYRTGESLDGISSFFAQSAEFAGRYGALDNGQFVDRIYQNVLGRAPDAGGRAFWTAELDSGRRTRGQVMAGFSESAEYSLLTAAEVHVTMAYAGMLQRAPDPGGFSFWVQHLEQGNGGAALIAGFLNSSEYRSRFLP